MQVSDSQDKMEYCLIAKEVICDWNVGGWRNFGKRKICPPIIMNIETNATFFTYCYDLWSELNLKTCEQTTLDSIRLFAHLLTARYSRW